jgi:16S rRNA (guanine527-N7)-methyltransferase
MNAADVEVLERAAERLGLSLEPAAIDRLRRFVDLLSVWNERFRLTGERDAETVVRKHVVDSLALAPHLPPAGPVLDIGSGAGFPGLVIACVRPDLDVRLVESRRKPSSFLAEALRTIGLPSARVVEARAEELAADSAWQGLARVAAARGLRPDVFLPLAAPLLASDGVVILMQTPRAAAQAVSAAGQAGFRPLRRADYVLPGGEQRCLLFFDRLC